jgi:hypothetical protein
MNFQVNNPILPLIIDILTGKKKYDHTFKALKLKTKKKKAKKISKIGPTAKRPKKKRVGS